MTESSNNNNHSNGNGNANSSDFNGRSSASPARTIDSHDSTTGSMDTIVDRSLNREELLQVATIEQSTNTTNGGSLTNSQIAMLQQQQPQQSPDEPQPQQQQQHLDAQSHIYSSPVYDQKPLQPLKLTAATLLANALGDEVNSKQSLSEQPKLITHQEFKQQLEEAMATRSHLPPGAAAASNKTAVNTIDSRISKKQRFPPEFIKYKEGSSSFGGEDGAGSTLSSKLRRKYRASNECCSAFPLQIVLGTLQLVLAVSLVALGSLLIVRNAALSMAGCGIWTGLTAAVTGSLGVVSMRKTQTPFLALSLVCIATSTLALAISGVGLSRDLNRMAEEKAQFDLMNANSEVSAACGLIFALFLHFVVSIVSVYRCALQICTRSQHSQLRDVIIKSNASGIALDQQKVDQYIKAMSLKGSEKEHTEKLAAMWMYATQMGSLPPASVRKLTPPRRPIMLIPASAAGSGLLPPPPPTRLPPPPPGGMLLPVPPPPQYRGLTMPYVRPGSLLYAHPASLTGTYRTHKSTKSAELNGQRRRRRAGKGDVNRRQRRKSEADVLDGAPNFQYTGLDRAIADSFLERQQQSQAGSHIDYSSSTSSTATSEAYAQQPTANSRASSKTKIVCRDVVM